MYQFAALFLLTIAAFAAGALAVLCALVIAGAGVLTQGMAMGGAFDPITAGIAVGLGSVAWKALGVQNASEVPA